MKKQIACVLTAFLLSAYPALGQENGASAASTTDPAKIAMGEKIFDLIIGKQDMQARLAAVQQVVIQNLPQNPAQPQQAARAQAAVSGLGPIMQSLMPQMREAYAQGYARHFTADELQSIYAFYQSPAGAKMTTEAPAISTEVMQVILPQLMTRIRALQPPPSPASSTTPAPKP